MMILPALREDINGVSNDTVETTALITRCCTLNRGNLQLGHGVFDTGTRKCDLLAWYPEPRD